MSLEACLPADLRGPGTTITKVSAGLSGTGVYRVAAAGEAFALKISSESEPLTVWRRKLHIQRLAANAGLAPVLSHNDVNPTNLVFDGEKLLLVDWETAGRNDPFYDPATISVFARMDEGACQRMLSTYDGAPMTRLPERFVYYRRLVAVLAGAMFLHLARQSGHAGATGTETLGSTPSLGDFYQRIRAGTLNVGTGDGQWLFGLSLLKDSFAL